MVKYYVDEGGIALMIPEDDLHYTVIEIPKDVFVEAYNKYIVNQD